jgi:tyrosine aminotransferase
MYAMVRIRFEYFDMPSGIQTDVDFTTRLLQEENVLVLPGTCFGMADSFRVVFCAPKSVLEQAAERIQQFCHRHRAQALSPNAATV